MGAPNGVPIAVLGRADVPDRPDRPDLRALGVEATPQQVVERIAQSRARDRTAVPARVHRRPGSSSSAGWSSRSPRRAGSSPTSSPSGRRSSSAASRSRSSCPSLSIFFATIFAVDRCPRPAVADRPHLRRGDALRLADPRHAADHPALLLVPRAAAVRDRPAGHRVRDLRPRLQLRRLHDRDLPGRHPGDPARPDRGGGRARHDRAARRCAGSCCRRRRGS